MKQRDQLRKLMDAAGSAGRRCLAVFRLTFLLLLPAAGASLWFGTPAAAEDKAPSVEQVKAACLLNLPKYVEWPAAAFAQADSPIVLAEFGESEVGEKLREMVKGKAINGHPLVFKRISSEEEIESGVHILFIGDSDRRRIPEAIDRLGGKSVLTVGESEGFLDKGGMILLSHRERKIRLEINLVAAKQARLVISSKLLSVAGTVKGKVN
jgi:hypothetical protein